MSGPRILVLAHVFYADLWGELAGSIRRLGDRPFDLRVNAVAGHVDPGFAGVVAADFPGAAVTWSANRGLDVGGTLALLGHVDPMAFDLVCKLHTKKSAYDPGLGEGWRRELLRAVLDDPAAALAPFDDPAVTMVGSAAWCYRHLSGNGEAVAALCGRLGLDAALGDGDFVAGSMFWCRPYVLGEFRRVGLTQAEFPEGYAGDGTLAHAAERVFGALARSRGRIVGR